MDLTNSEGITFKKPPNVGSKLGSGRKRKQPMGSSDSHESIDLDVDILRTFEEPSETIPRRVELYEKNLEHLQLSLQKVHDKFNNDLNEKLLKFVGSCFRLIEKVNSVVPIGILESGLSFGENCVIFDHIENELTNLSNEQEKVFVIRIQSGTSPSTKAVFQKLCRQLIDEEDSRDEEVVSEDSSPEKKDTRVRKTAKHYNLYDVKQFLSSMKQKYKIIIIIEDVDYFANSIITQTLTLMGCAGFPITFIFGATHGHFIQNLIPLSCSSEYVVEKFYSVSPKDRLNEFMRLVLFEPNISFRVSGPIISYLDSYYKEDNYSVDQIFQSIKFCMRYHFLTAKSAFCSLDRADTYPEGQVNLFTETVEEINSNKETPRKRMKAKSIPPEKLLNSTCDGLKAWNFLSRLLCFINLRLPSYPLGEAYALVYISCYDGYNPTKESDDSEPFARFFKDLNSLPKADFQMLLEDCIDFLQKPKNLPDIDWSADVLVHFKETLSNLKSEEGTKTNADRKDEPKKTMKLRQQKSLKELQESLLEKKRQIEGTSAMYQVRTDFVDVFKKLLKKYLLPFSTLKNSDIFVSSDLNQLINAHYPANFLQLNEDITSPEYVLQCSCCSNLHSSIDATLPDVCIINKLFSEHTTKKVDLNLIYHAFLSVVQPETTKRKSTVGSSKNAAATASYLIRFRRAVGELQHMGFVKRSKSKPDEVSRLTWW